MHKLDYKIKELLKLMQLLINKYVYSSLVNYFINVKANHQHLMFVSSFATKLLIPPNLPKKSNTIVYPSWPMKNLILLLQTYAVCLLLIQKMRVLIFYLLILLLLMNYLFPWYLIFIAIMLKSYLF